MKKIIMFFIFILLLCPFIVNANSYKVKVNLDNLVVYNGPGTNYGNIYTLPINSLYPFVGDKVPSEGGCSGGWYKIIYLENTEGYVCSENATVVEVDDNGNEVVETCEQKLERIGFPSSYLSGLCALKALHPNWEFVPDINNRDFQTVVNKESVVGMSLIDSPYQGYYSTAPGSYDYLTDKFTVKEGKSWYAANSRVVAYYLDPRNFFDSKGIFMFEKLSFDASYQTEEAIQRVLSGRDIIMYSSTILSAAGTYNANGIYLASKIRQETGGNFSNYSLSGRSITYNGVTYPHVYNPYNIGANTGAYDGLVWAVKGTSYLRPWTTLTTAINGGAMHISSTYISKGQDTIYFQKFNTSSYTQYSSYAHQYMTNIRGASSEANIAYSGYNGMDLLNSTDFIFVIPVYLNMAPSYELPNKGNPNNHLRDLKVNSQSVVDFEHDKYDYTFYVAKDSTSATIEATVINSEASVIGAGIIDLIENETNCTVAVTAANGDVQNYTIRIVKTDGIDLSVVDILKASLIPVSNSFIILQSGNTVESLTLSVQKIAASATISVNGKTTGILGTGDTVSITNGSDTQTYNIVIKGDTSGDGLINIQDLLRVQKHILHYLNLTGSYEKSADVNQDGVVNIQDLLRIQKHILGYLQIG